MKIKVKYKAMDLRGNIVYLTKAYVCPDFKEESYSHTQKINNKSLTVNLKTDIDSQIISWIDDQDKKELMYEQDWNCIIDYTLVGNKKTKGVSKSALLKSILQELFKDKEKMLIDFMVCYKRMKQKISRLPVDKQISIVLETLGIGYDAKSEAYERIGLILKGEYPDDEKTRLELKKEELKKKYYLNK